MNARDQNTVEFLLNGQPVTALAGETLLQAADRYGVEIPRLCYKEGMRPDGNCRSCMVEIKGERVLAPSCCRYPKAGMEVISDNERALASQKMVLELLLSDVTQKEYTLDSELDQWAKKLNIANRVSRRGIIRRRICRIRRWRSISMPVSSAPAACAPAAKSRSTT